jgi:hypothetical protein
MRGEKREGINQSKYNPEDEGEEKNERESQCVALKIKYHLREDISHVYNAQIAILFFLFSSWIVK